MFPWALLQHLTPGPVVGVIVCDDKAWLPQDTRTVKGRGNKNWRGFQFVLTGLKPHACGFGLILDLQNPFQTLPLGGLQAPRSDVKTIALLTETSPTITSSHNSGRSNTVCICIHTYSIPVVLIL